MCKPCSVRVRRAQAGAVALVTCVCVSEIYRAKWTCYSCQRAAEQRILDNGRRLKTLLKRSHRIRRKGNGNRRWAIVVDERPNPRSGGQLRCVGERKRPACPTVGCARKPWVTSDVHSVPEWRLHGAHCESAEMCLCCREVEIW